MGSLWCPVPTGHPVIAGACDRAASVGDYWVPTFVGTTKEAS